MSKIETAYILWDKLLDQPAGRPVSSLTMANIHLAVRKKFYSYVDITIKSIRFHPDTGEVEFLDLEENNEEAK